MLLLVFLVREGGVFGEGLCVCLTMSKRLDRFQQNVAHRLLGVKSRPSALGETA